ncbi:hypothetical protein CCACVL1_14509 [Corchorus capsularis]|uniref:Uncharacterized protein n=1 Tax=Corchorus capsularis TaxID=210143 RepID=A0A1R3I6S0_COCAP|nr:hypothetical protein CCACVL1_14509 [Corchorus capsularis]
MTFFTVKEATLMLEKAQQSSTQTPSLIVQPYRTMKRS